jgi:hypothetical protein
MPRDEEVTPRAGSLRSMTGLTEAEFRVLLPPVEPAFVASMQHRTMDGTPRTSRRSRADANCPLPTRADTRRCILTDLKQHPLQEGQGQLFGMRQSQANTGIHVRHPVLTQAVANQDLLPARTAEAFAAMCETPAADGSSGIPLCGMMVLNVRSTARPLPKRNKHSTAARSRVTRAQTSSCSRRPVTCGS